jgi:hypothetical protein
MTIQDKKWDELALGRKLIFVTGYNGQDLKKHALHRVVCLSRERGVVIFHMLFN